MRGFWALIAWALFLAGCPYIFLPPDLAGVTHDADGDGFFDLEGDCDDFNPTIYPGATELCDGLANDCNISTLPANEVDDDGDGYVECIVDSSGWQGFTVAGGGDCDDSNNIVGQSTFPGAAPHDGGWCLKDVDDDDYGDAHPPRSDVDAGTDCEDELVAVYPQSLEVSLDGLDNDCDGQVDRIALQDTVKQTGESRDDLAGTAVSGIGDINGDGYDDFAVGAPDAQGTSGVAYLILGSAAGVGEMSLSSASTRLEGPAAVGGAGYSLSGAGDVNQDGYDDVLVGSWSLYHSAAYLVLGSSSGVASMKLANADAVFLGTEVFDHAGESVSGAGDVNGDGYDDMVVGAYGYASYAGVAYVILGSATLAPSLSLADADATLMGEMSESCAGDAVSGGGDVDGDGFDDILVGAPGLSSEPGAVYLILGSAAGLSDIDLSQADAIFDGESAKDEAGQAVSAVGDINGDGYDDSLVGAPKNDESAKNAGAAYLLLGAAAVPSSALSNADAKLTGEGEGDNAGYSMAAAGDVNSDGFMDILIGAPVEDESGAFAGAAYLLLGAVSALPTVDLSGADAKLTGETQHQVGSAVSGAGDINGDGHPDLLIGAPYESSISDNAGAAFIVFGLEFL